MFNMKKDSKKYELRAEYDLSKLNNRVRGKYAERYKLAKPNYVTLDFTTAVKDTPLND